MRRAVPHGVVVDVGRLPAAATVPDMVAVRSAGPQDELFLFLLRMLAMAADWRPGARLRSVEEVLASPDLAHYVPELSRGRDRGVVALAGAEPSAAVGASWWRLLPAEDPGYGFVSPDVPEVSVAVEAGHRGQGIGTLLLGALVAAASEDGLPGLSLSVEPDNYAVGLYRRLGFVRVGTNGGAETMLLTLR